MKIKKSRVDEASDRVQQEFMNVERTITDERITELAVEFMLSASARLELQHSLFAISAHAHKIGDMETRSILVKAIYRLSLISAACAQGDANAAKKSTPPEIG